MEPEGASPCSQKTAAQASSQPPESNSQPTYLPPTPRYITMWFSHMVPFAHGFRIKLRLFFPHKYSHLTHPDLISSKYLVRTNHDGPHSTVTKHLPVSFSLSPVHTFPSSLFVQTPTIDDAVYRSRYRWLSQPWNHGYISGRVKRCFIFQSAHTQAARPNEPLIQRTKSALPGANVSTTWTRLSI